MARSVLVDIRCNVFPTLRASYEVVDVRMPWLRVVSRRSRGLVTDFGILNRAIPFLDRLTDRSTLSVVLSGAGRFDERTGPTFLNVGDMAASDFSAGTEAYSGDTLTVEWSPRMLGAAQGPGLSVTRLSALDTGRMAELAGKLDGPGRALAVVGILDVLRANGLAIGEIATGDLSCPTDEARQLQRLQNVVSERLTALYEFPVLEEVSSGLGWDQRRVHRRLSRLRETYSIVWHHWREFVHQARMLRAMQLLSIPGTTTELVARLSGFRSPSALCHAFAKADLPSPGRMSTIARVGALDGWSALAA
jgi:AraC-like DNA-binding protein